SFRMFGLLWFFAQVSGFKNVHVGSNEPVAQFLFATLLLFFGEFVEIPIQFVGQQSDKWHNAVGALDWRDNEALHGSPERLVVGFGAFVNFAFDQFAGGIETAGAGDARK